MVRYQIINIQCDIVDELSLNSKFVCDQNNKRKDSTFEVDFFQSHLFNNYLEGYPCIKKDIFPYRLVKDVIFIDQFWKQAWILAPIFSKKCINSFVAMLFYTHAVQRHIIQFHSSLIATPSNRGLMFLGPSGIGKTTQAEFWNKYRDALIINGDIVFVQETDDAFLGWGTPWHGSSPYCENTNVPVEALIVLKQAPENSIRELAGFEKVTAVSNNVFYPRWLENGMELCLETLDHLLTKIPVYELSCRPDEDAVQLTEATIFGP